MTSETGAGAGWAVHLPPGCGPVPEVLGCEVPLPRQWATRWASQPERRALLADGGGTAGREAGVPTHRRRRAELGSPPGLSNTVFYGELDEWSRAVAARLAARGLCPGDRVLWVADGDLPSVVVLVAALRAGLVVVPVSGRLTPAELAHVIEDAAPSLVVTASPELAGVVHAGAGGADQLTDQLPVHLAEELTAPGSGGSGDTILDAVTPDDPALIIYTSGTTGAPKGAIVGHRALAAGIGSLALAWRVTAEDRLVLALPLFHVHGLCAGLLGMLTAGASVVLQARFDPALVLDAVAGQGVSLLYGVPTMYHRLAAHGGAGALARLRLCVSGSAPLAAELWKRLAREAGVELLERYGMTETLLTVSNPYDGPRRPGTVGFPLPGVEARVAVGRQEDGSREGGLRTGPGLVAAGSGDAAGELLVRGPTLFQGYWRRPSATAECLVDGWFRTGDIVGYDDHGYLVVRGRATELIITGGHNVYPAEVEDALLAHPGVHEAAVAGVASEEWGEEVVAWVVADGVDAAELEALAAERLAPFKRPRRYRFVTELPRNAMGKLQRAALRG